MTGTAQDGLHAGAPPQLPAGITVAQLSAAVSRSRSWRGVLREVGLTSPRQGRRLRQACDELGIDYGHFRRHRAEDDALASAVALSASWDEVMARLGHSPDSGSARASLRGRCARLGIDVSHVSAPPAREPQDPLFAPPNRLHLRAAGSLLVAAACTLAGHRVSWPLEPAPYDLVVVAQDRMLRVQVKTTTTRVDGAWLCRISRSEYARAAGGKRPVPYSPSDIDYFAIVDGELSVYLLPVGLVSGRSAVSLRKYEAFRLPTLEPAPWPIPVPGGGSDTASG